MKKRKPLRQICCFIPALLLLAGLPVFAAEKEADPFGLALSFTGDTACSITATWRDSTQAAEVMQIVPETKYDKTGFAGAEEFPADFRDISLDSSGVWHYEATASGLSAGTAYVYRVGKEGSWSKAYRFAAADPKKKDVTFLYMGDVQPANDIKEEFALWGELSQAAFSRNPELAFAVLGGDIVNSGISIEQFDRFRENAEPVFASVPLMAANGNHESNFPDTGKPELYLDIFAFPENGPRGFSEEFYSFDYGNCHILVLNSWIFSGEQKLTEYDFERVNNWIKSDLAASSADWQIAVTHVPVYAVHDDAVAEAVKKAWAPIFEKYGVDLVFTGHQHVYSRSRPIYEGKVDYEKGIPYIMGVSGSKFYSSADETLAEKTVYNTSNYQLVRVDGDLLTVQTLDSQGKELDYSTVTKRGLYITRGDYIEALWKAAGSPASGSSPFKDDKSQKAAWAYETGLVKGYGNGCFGPEDPVFQWQVDLIISRMGGK